MTANEVLTDEQASDKFVALCEWRAREAGIKSTHPHLNEDIADEVAKDHPELAAQHERWCDGWLLRHRQSRR